MRILEIREQHSDEDIAQARKIVEEEVGHPAKTVMIIRGSTAEVGQFADRAAVRSDAFPWREVVWVKGEGILTTQQADNWFGNDDTACAAVLDFNDAPAVHLTEGSTLYAIEQAFLQAQQQ